MSPPTRESHSSGVLYAIGGMLTIVLIGIVAVREITSSNHGTVSLDRLRIQAVRGDDSAALTLAAKYAHGDGMPQSDREAAMLVRLAAERGNAKAQYMLSGLYGAGRGVPANSQEELQWCRRAADQGYPAAQTALGLHYYAGAAVPRDMREAARWLLTAAHNGDQQAQGMVGVMHANGEGLPRDDKEAYFWLLLAHRQDEADSVSGLDAALREEARVLSRDEIEAAEQRVQQWLRRHRQIK